jgi:hypothetical protein
MDAAPPAFDLAQNATAAFHAAYGSVLTAQGDALVVPSTAKWRAGVADVNPPRYLSA